MCDDDYILGGFDILKTGTDFFSRTYTGLTSHIMIYYTMTLWAVDSWDAGDTFFIEFDSFQQQGLSLAVENFKKQSCGTLNWKDLGPIRIFGRAPHIGTSLTFSIKGAFNETPDNESFGFRDLNLLFVQNPSQTTSYFCGLAPISLPSNECSCPEGQYLSQLGVCLPCHPACSSCFETGANNCYQCAKGASFFQNSCIFCHASCDLCSEPTKCITCKHGLFLFENQCIPECPSPFNQITNGCENTCSVPCIAPNYLYWDESCLGTCSFPLHQTTEYSKIQKCIYPCGTGEYLYWDGSCQQTCPSILTTRIDRGVKYCDYPCTNNEFLYWNGSCNAICNPPLVQAFDKNRQFCVYPCSIHEFLNFDGSCLPSCDPPFLSLTVASMKYCQHPCSNTSYFIYWDNTCQQACLPPLQQVSRPFLLTCVPSCQPSQFLLWNGTCIDECKDPSTIQNSYFGNKCILPCENPLYYYYEELGQCKQTCDSYSIIENNLYFKCLAAPSALTSGFLVDLFLIISPESESISFHSVNKLLQPIKYLDIPFPQRVKTFLLNKGRNIISLKLGKKISQDIQESFIEKGIPSIFEIQKLHSSFLVNFWPNLTSLWIIFGIGILIFAFRIISKIIGWRLVESFCKNILFIPIWNLIIVLFLTHVDDIILFSYLEFKTFEGDSVADVFSLLVNILFITILGLLYIGSLYLSIRAQSLKENDLSRHIQLYPSFIQKYVTCQVLFRGYNKGAFYGHLFYPFYILRLALPMIIATSYFSTPLLQTILYVLISLVTLTYLIIAKPIKSNINNFQLILFEGILLIINFSAFLLTILNIFENEDYEISIYLGDLIILGNLLLNFLVMSFLAFKIFFGLKAAIIFRKQNNKLERGAWYHLLFLPIQQGGLGFEEAMLVEMEFQKLEKKEQNLAINQKQISQKNSSRAFSEKSFADTTRIESNFGISDQLDKSKHPLHDMNEEIITFSQTEAIWNPAQVSLPNIDDQNASDAFPIQKIMKKSRSSYPFE